MSAAGLRTLRAVAFATYKEWAAYRSHMLLSLVTGPAFFLAQIFAWKAVYAGRESLAGFSSMLSGKRRSTRSSAR